jgi:uncharacterized GH25 family protein
MTSRSRALLLALALPLLTLASPAHAHDYWLEFAPLRATTNGAVSLSLHVGEDFTAEQEKPMQRDRTVSLRHLRSAGEVDLLPGAVDGVKPLLRVSLEPGGHLFGLERNISRIEMRALKFNRYLKHEGLAAAYAARKGAGERLRRGRERYTRYLKAFVQAGDVVDGVSTRVLGHTIELVPDRDLATLRPGERFAMTLRFEGAPLAGAMIEAFVRPPSGGEPRGQKAVTDASGRVEFTATEAGAWLVRTVHMRRCKGCTDVDWESFWTGYSFALPG